MHKNTFQVDDRSQFSMFSVIWIAMKLCEILNLVVEIKINRANLVDTFVIFYCCRYK